jgi:glucose/arabinose dehydrogenase
MKHALVAIACLAIAACSKDPPSTEPPAQGERITGSERFGWEQQASDSTELAAIRYAIYVDGVRSELTGVSCATSASDAGFACSGPLPRMSPGSHSLELASFTVDGALLESPRSTPFLVVVSAAVTGLRVDTTADTRHAPEEQGKSDRRSVASIATLDGERLTLDRVAGGLNKPADLAFAPDGRLFIAERSGRVRSFNRGGLAEPTPPIDDVAPAGEGGLLGIALDPGFERTHWIYAIYTATSWGRSRSGAPVFRVARFREVGGALAERAVLLDDLPVSPIRPAASIRFGGDGKLYIAIDDGGNARSAGDLASLNGKILRLNADGTTPRDQSNPVYSIEHRSPRGFDWHPTRQVLWIVGGVTSESVRASAIADSGPPRRGAVRTSYELSRASNASSVTFYRGGLIPSFRDNLLIGSREDGAGLLRIRIDANDATRVVSIERLFENQLDAVRALTMGPDGAVFLCTGDALLRLAPE